MSEFKGSKGLDLQGEFIVSDNSNTVCEMYEYTEENRANAQLFITAPEMLEALINITDQFECLLNSLYGQNIDVIGWHQNGDVQSFDSFVDDNDEGNLEKAKNVINKATQINQTK